MNVLGTLGLTKTVKGRAGNQVIEEPIEQYQANISEQVRTARRNIINKFKSLGYTEKDIKFDE